MAGPITVKKLQCWQGVNMLEQFVFFTLPTSGSTDPQNLVPMSFTSAHARMAIRMAQDPASTSLITLTDGAGLTFITDTFTPGPPMPSANNGIAIAITPAQSLSMNGGVAISGYYDLMIDNPDGTTTLLLAGQFDLLPTVSR